MNIPPRLEFKRNNGSSYLVSKIRDGRKDWSYSFDLCGSLYRLSDVKSIIDTAVSNPDKYGNIRNPNLLEVIGNKLFTQITSFRMYESIISSTRYVLSVTAVNRVQSVFEVPIFHCHGGDIASLNAFISNGDGKSTQRLDFDRYRNTISLSVHVGQLFMEHEDEVETSRIFKDISTRKVNFV